MSWKRQLAMGLLLYWLLNVGTIPVRLFIIFSHSPRYWSSFKPVLKAWCYTFHITVLIQELANYNPQASFSQPSDFILPRTKNSFYFYKWLKKIKRIIFHAMWKLYEIRVSVFTNSFIGRQPYSFIYALSRASSLLQGQQPTSCDTDPVTCKA